jgi:hypothetical protein
MMMYSRASSRFHFEQATPQRGLDAELWCDRSQTFGARRLCRSLVKLGWADNANWGIDIHHVR